MTLTVGSLFSGIGGLDLGLERAGMKVIWQSEINPYANQVLAKHWPTIPNYGDIKNIDWTQLERPDVISGGYPCQPFSQAGHRKGEEDPRHLWPWVRDAISALRPRYAIMENVRGHLSLGGTTVLADLAAIGYDAEWDIISAQSVGANHRRDRIFIVAYPNGSNSADGRQRENVPREDPSGGDDRSGSGSDFGEVSVGGTGQGAGNVAYPSRQFGDGVNDHPGNSARPETPPEFRNRRRSQNVAYPNNTWNDDGDTGGERAQVLTERRRVFNETIASSRAEQYGLNWVSEPDVGRVADGVPRRVDRLKCLGNAVVPQVAEYVGRLVMEDAK